MFFYLKEFSLFENPYKQFIIFLMSIIMGFISFLLILNKKLQIEEKFAYFSLISIFLNVYAWQVLLILFPFSLLVFLMFLNKEIKVLDFLKKNKILILGLIGIIGISFMPEFNFSFYKYAPFLENNPYNVIVSLRWVFFVSMIGISILILHIKKWKQFTKNKIKN